MGINKFVEKRNFNRTVEAMNNNCQRISGWCKRYDEYKEFVSQKEKYNSLYRNTEISYHN